MEGSAGQKDQQGRSGCTGGSWGDGGRFVLLVEVVAAFALKRKDSWESEGWVPASFLPFLLPPPGSKWQDFIFLWFSKIPSSTKGADVVLI